MGLWDRLVGRAPADLIEWVEAAGHDALAVRQSGLRLSAESALLVRPGQACVVSSGDVADVLGPGRHHLTPSALPELTAANVVRDAGSSFRGDVSFVSVVPHTDLRWGTVASVVARDSNNAALPAKASGELAFVVTDPAAFVREVVAPGDGPGVSRAEVAALVTSQFSEIFRTGGLDGADLIGPPGRLGLVAGEKLASNLRLLGITLVRFVVKNVTVAADVRRPPNPFSSTGVDGYRAELPPPLFPDVPPVAVPTAPPVVPVLPVVPAQQAPPVRPVQPPPPLQQAPPMLPTGFPALPASLADILEPSLPPSTGPNSVRLPLAKDAPEGIFTDRQPKTGPKSERLLLGQPDPSAAPENGTANEHLFVDLSRAAAPNSHPVAPAPVAAAAVVPAVAEVSAPLPPPAPAAREEVRLPGPPPLPATLEFHVAINGTAVGPFDLIVLAARVRDGSLGRKSLVWRPGMGGWSAAESVTELAPLFEGPPPIPTF